jgi:aerobic carbon-monoxide dehydrogenase small subunit
VTALRLVVDGRRHQLDEALGGESLLRVLRDELGVVGVKDACEQGECGSCTVTIDGELACACLVPAA